MAKALYTIELCKTRRPWFQKYFWRIVHRNGNILATSEMYANKQDRDDVAHALSAHMKDGDAEISAE